MASLLRPALLPRVLPGSLARLPYNTIHPIRHFTSVQPPPPSEKDPSHPHLWFHPTSSLVSLSFLPHPPAAARGSRTVLGYLPVGEATLDDFREEPKFREVLDGAIKSGLEQGKATTVQFEAETRPTDGWIHITDERAIPPAGRIGETEDIIGSVYVQEGKIVADTYSPLPTYRLVTPNGVLTLPQGLDTHLISILESIDSEERKATSVDQM